MLEPPQSRFQMEQENPQNPVSNWNSGTLTIGFPIGILKPTQSDSQLDIQHWRRLAFVQK